MQKETTLLVTGANRGLGLGIAKLLLSDPNARVILTTRQASTDLRRLLPAEFPGTLVGIYHLDSTSDFDHKALAEALQDSAIDIIIANAGTGEVFSPVREAPIEEFRNNYEVNALGPIRLFQALWDNLSKSTNPKFVLISSILGSISDMDPSPCGAYGASKAAGNYLIKKMHLENDRLVTLSIHPGWVQTNNGQAYADAVGVKEPPLSVDESAPAILKHVLEASKESTSGKYIDVINGIELPW